VEKLAPTDVEEGMRVGADRPPLLTFVENDVLFVVGILSLLYSHNEK